MRQALLKTFSRNLASRRRGDDLAQADLAERVNVSTEFISRLERGVALPSIETLVMLCDVLRCTPNDLLLKPAADRSLDDLRARMANASPTAIREAVRVADAMLSYSTGRTKPTAKTSRRPRRK